MAYHEGGHAIVARLTPGADPVHRVTIVPHGQALGVTEQRPEEDRRNYPRDYLMGRLGVTLGGRAAEDVVFGQPTTGSESDLKVATSLARRMVGLWGMNDEVGPVSYGVGETQPFLGRELAAPREYAEATAARIDEAVTEILTEARDRATTIIRSARPALDALAAELVAHEMVDSQRLDEILRAGRLHPGAGVGPRRARLRGNDAGRGPAQGARSGPRRSWASRALTMDRDHPLQPFVDVLPVPDRRVVTEPSRLTIPLRTGLHRYHRDLPPSPVWTFDGTVPGPTVEVHRGVPLEVRWENGLTGNLPVIVTVAPANELDGVPVQTTLGRSGGRPDEEAAALSGYAVVHLHGALTYATSDGWTENLTAPGQWALDTYPNEQRGALLWYHDHVMGVTRFSVYAGLAGLWIVRDDLERELGLPGRTAVRGTAPDPGPQLRRGCGRPSERDAVAQDRSGDHGVLRADHDRQRDGMADVGRRADDVPVPRAERFECPDVPPGPLARRHRRQRSHRPGRI